MKKVHLSEEAVRERIAQVEEQLKEVQDEEGNKNKRTRLYRKLAQLNKALTTPTLRVDPEVTAQRIAKHRERKYKKLQQLKQKHKNANKKTKKLCLHCHQKGHLLTNCPENPQGKRFCYKCGSQEHSHGDCQVNGYSYAKCFHCNETGHIANECPQKQSQGIYFKGGSCHRCGSVWHLAKNCEERKPVIFNNEDE